VPHSICNLRTDSVALLLNITNINCQSEVCLVDNTRGFLLGCAMEKLPKSILRVEFAKINSLKNDIDYYENFNHPYFLNTKVTFVTQKMLLDKTCPISKAFTRSFYNRYTSFLICHDQYHALDVYKVMDPLLAQNCFCAAFCIFINPLREMQEWLQKERKGLRIKLEELLTREIQVLPLRTHPMMSMHGSSGYILSWIKL